MAETMSQRCDLPFRLLVTHRPELIPTGADQRRYHPPLGDGFGGVAAMPEGVAVAPRRPDPISAAVKPTASPTRHSR
jgi:hypothetical protein